MPRRIMLNILINIFIVYIGLVLLVKFLEKTAVFYPGKSISTTPASALMGYEDLYLTTPDGVKINAWLVKTNDQAPTVIFAHGNAGTMSERVMKVKFFHDLGLNMLIFDYRGYGRSQGTPSEEGIYLDAQTAYDYLQTRQDLGHSRIIGYGASLGGAVIIELAKRRKVAGLIIESSITSARGMAKLVYPYLPTFWMTIKFDSISKIGSIDVPKLFLHSPEDHTVPIIMSKRLFEAAQGPKEFIMTHGGHNEGALVNDPKIKEQFASFLRKHSLL